MFELVSRGIGGNTVEALMESMTVSEFNMWYAWKKLHGKDW